MSMYLNIKKIFRIIPDQTKVSEWSQQAVDSTSVHRTNPITGIHFLYSYPNVFNKKSSPDSSTCHIDRNAL